jgi:phosphatidate cytidylyltransferase
MLKDLGRRLIVSGVIIPIVICLAVFSKQVQFQYIVAAVIAALTAVAVWEYMQFAKAKGGYMTSPALLTITVFQVLSFYLAARIPALSYMPLLIFFLGFLILFALHFREQNGAVVNLAVASFGLLYVAVPMGMTLAILYTPSEDGRWWIAYLVAVTKITDVGAYFAGSLWGRRKLAPRISPGKTVEGALFGLGCAILASFAFHLISDYSGAVHFHLGTIEWLTLGLILGITGQFADLSESLLKRDANKKDSNVLPGLGGMLDAVDSILFNAPIIYLYLSYMKNTVQG